MEGGVVKTLKVIGGFRLADEASRKLATESAKGRVLTVQQLFKGSAYDEAKIWTIASRALAKQTFVLAYLALTVCGTTALAAASILLAVKK